MRSSILFLIVSSAMKAEKNMVTTVCQMSEDSGDAVAINSQLETESQVYCTSQRVLDRSVFWWCVRVLSANVLCQCALSVCGQCACVVKLCVSVQTDRRSINASLFIVQFIHHSMIIQNWSSPSWSSGLEISEELPLMHPVCAHCARYSHCTTVHCWMNWSSEKFCDWESESTLHWRLFRCASKRM